jgi:hypothetical protein
MWFCNKLIASLNCVSTKAQKSTKQYNSFEEAPAAVVPASAEFDREVEDESIAFILSTLSLGTSPLGAEALSSVSNQDGEGFHHAEDDQVALLRLSA